MDHHPGAAGRRAYLAAMLEELCEEIGIRDAGSDGDGRATATVHRELAAGCDSAEIAPFPFERWSIASPVRLSVGSAAVECYPFYGSADTLGVPLSGTLRRTRTEDSLPVGLEALVLSEGDGRPAALLVASPFGPAVPRFDETLTSRGVPVVGVDRRRYASIETETPAATLEFSTTLAAGATTANVVGRLAGRERGEILLIAHRDTQYTTPGANDNAASLVVMLLLARHFARRRLRRSLILLASGAEEIGCLGAREYARRRSDDGTFGELRLCLNFDSLTYGRHPQIYSPDEDLASLLSACYREHDPRARPRRFPERDILDGAPFAERGARTIYLNSRGDDDRKLGLWHRPEDLPATVDPRLVELSFCAIAGFLEAVDEEL